MAHYLYRDNLPDHELNTARILEEQKKANKAMFVVLGMILAFPALLIGGGFFMVAQMDKPEEESLEASIRNVGTKILDRDDCEEGVEGYYAWNKQDGKVLNDEIVICTNNFNKGMGGYAALLKHEMTHIMQACLGTTINSPDEIRQLRAKLKGNNESSYRTIHGAYSEKDHFHEVEARWMESQDFVYVNEQLQKHCNSRYVAIPEGGF